MSGRESALTSGYLFSYMALAAMAQARYSLAKVSRMSMTAQPMAPVASALALMASRPSCSWPRSPTTAMTSRSYSSCSHLMHTEVSRPPE